MNDTAEVTKDEFILIAGRASGEIKNLRAQIAFLQPKAQAYDALVAVLGMIPRQNQTMGQDLAAMLDKRVEFLSKPIEPEEQTVEGVAP